MKIPQIACDWDECPEHRPEDAEFQAEASSELWGRVVQVIQIGIGSGRGKKTYRTVDLCPNHAAFLEHSGLNVKYIG